MEPAVFIPIQNKSNRRIAKAAVSVVENYPLVRSHPT